METFSNLGEAMTAGAAHAVVLAAEQSITLDYSIESLREVERQLDQLHRQLPAAKPSEAQLHMMAMTFGAYIAEVIRRNFGGHWSEDCEFQPGVKFPTFHLPNCTVEIWPQVKVRKRLENGAEDNVWHYAQAFIQKIEGTR